MGNFSHSIRFHNNIGSFKLSVILLILTFSYAIQTLIKKHFTCI